MNKICRKAEKKKMQEAGSILSAIARGGTTMQGGKKVNFMAQTSQWAK